MRPYPLPATPHGSRTAVRSDCGYKGVSAPLRIIAHRLLHLFHGMVLIARPERGHGVPAAWLGTEGMYLAALYCHGIISRTFFVKERSRNRSGSPAAVWSLLCFGPFKSLLFQILTQFFKDTAAPFTDSLADHIKLLAYFTVRHSQEVGQQDHVPLVLRQLRQSLCQQITDHKHFLSKHFKDIFVLKILVIGGGLCQLVRR